MTSGVGVEVQGSATHPSGLSLFWIQAAEWLTGAVMLTLRGY